MPVEDSTARALLKQVESLGYRVTVERDGDGYVMTAFHPRLHDRHEAKVFEGEEREYKCACRLAVAVGIDLEG